MSRSIAFLLCSLLVACGDSASVEAVADGKRIVVIPKGTTHVFWRSVEAGARDAATALGLEMTFKGPLRENDRATQKQLVQQFIGERVAGIALAPLDAKALVPEVLQAKERGIPVVIIDSALDGTPGEDFASFVATDNEKSGRLAGEEMVRLLGGGGRVVVLRYQVGSASTTAREEGFLQAARAGGLDVLVDNRYAGATIGEAKTAALNLADELRRADGVFCPCEPVTNGMVLAFDQLGLLGKKQLVGFDASPPLVAALRDGKVQALVVQNPRRMGRLAVEHLKALIDGARVDTVVDTGCVLATRANMDRPEVARLLR
ncbi:MAG TPA: sugar ABC transporter substrate-binding protein [bacterium]|nr:sugar ABC transporter substrate-binding protein [bacterium]